MSKKKVLTEEEKRERREERNKKGRPPRKKETRVCTNESCKTSFLIAVSAKATLCKRCQFNKASRERYHKDIKVSRGKAKTRRDDAEKKYGTSKKYYLKNKEKIILYRKKNKDNYSNYRKKWYRKNKEKIKKDTHRRALIRRKKDPFCRILHNLRSRIREFIKKIKKDNSKIKRNHLIENLGCSLEEFENHIKSLWKTGMSWSNYGKKEGQWSIDHIHPVSKFSIENLNNINHYTNLQPMWHTDNMKKGDKILEENKND